MMKLRIVIDVYRLLYDHIIIRLHPASFGGCRGKHWTGPAHRYSRHSEHLDLFDTEAYMK